MKNDWEDIIAVAAKELKFYLTDKVILLQILLIPFIVVFGYSLMLSTTLTSAQAHLSDPAGSCYSVNTPESFKAAFRSTISTGLNPVSIQFPPLYHLEGKGRNPFL